MSVPDGATCWICLDEGPDVHGRPLVRDCSCRGSNAGFAHLSCLVQYAGRKTTEYDEKGLADMSCFPKPWQICFNCKQPYRGKLSMDMTNAFVLFARKNYDYPGNNSRDKVKVMDALRVKVECAMDLSTDHKTKLFVEDVVESDIKEILNRVEHLKNTLDMASWVHCPEDDPRYGNYHLLRGNYEAFAHCNMGNLCILRNKDNNSCIEHYKKALTIYKLLDRKDEVAVMEAEISTLNQEITKYCGARDGDLVVPLQRKRDNYKYNIKYFGEDSERTVRSGLTYARALMNGPHRQVEAERLTIKLTARSRQIHGPDHEITKRAELELKECKSRIVLVRCSSPEMFQYQLLRYEDGGATCVTKGPIADPRNAEEEEILTVQSDRIIPFMGCPVTCHGLKSAVSLNGKLGDVRQVSCRGEVRCAVHFEDDDLKPALVKPENLRVVVELPPKEVPGKKSSEEGRVDPSESL